MILSLVIMQLIMSCSKTNNRKETKNYGKIIIKNISSKSVFINDYDLKECAVNDFCINFEKKIQEYNFSLAVSDADMSDIYYNFMYELQPGSEIELKFDLDEIIDLNCYRFLVFDESERSKIKKDDSKIESIKTIGNKIIVEENLGQANEIVYSYYVSKVSFGQGTYLQYCENIRKYGIVLNGTRKKNGEIIFEVLDDDIYSPHK